MLKTLIPIASLISVAVLLVLLNFTTPTGLGPFGVLLFFILIYVVVLGVATALVKIFRKILGKKGEMRRKDYECAAALALAPIMLMLAQSMGSLSLLTLILIGVFVSAACFWVLKRG